MKKSICCCLLILCLSEFCGYTAHATHLLGGHFAYTFLDSSLGISHYRVILTIYRDSIEMNSLVTKQDNPAYFAVYDGNNNLVQVDTVSYSYTSLSPGSSTGSCSDMATSTFLVSKATFIHDYFLPSGLGYTIVNQRCCFIPVDNMVTAGNTGLTSVCYIQPGVVVNNSALFTSASPVLTDVNEPFAFDCSANDIDGDSLTYDLCAAMTFSQNVLSGKPVPAPPPYDSVGYIAPLSSGYPLNSSPPLTIDNATGMITATPDAIGKYVVSVCCHEWRLGKPVNTTQRIFVLTVLNCQLSTPNLVVESTDIYPNPTNNEITVSYSGKVRSLAISNTVGQVVFTHEYNNRSEVSVDVSRFPAGLYFVKINDSEVRKLVK